MTYYPLSTLMLAWIKDAKKMGKCSAYYIATKIKAFWCYNS